eukprot:scaffold907_cov398-Prasinococcus_capsulatus_cf.AAC.1
MRSLPACGPRLRPRLDPRAGVKRLGPRADGPLLQRGRAAVGLGATCPPGEPDDVAPRAAPILISPARAAAPPARSGAGGGAECPAGARGVLRRSRPRMESQGEPTACDPWHQCLKRGTGPTWTDRRTASCHALHPTQRPPRRRAVGWGVEVARERTPLCQPAQPPAATAC